MAEADMTERLTPDLEKTLRGYVLSHLAEPVRSELEEQLITDPDAFEALGVVEDELIDEYLDATGTPAERRSFEEHFLTSPQRLRRLHFARALRARASTPSAGVQAAALPAAGVRVRPPRLQPAWVGIAAVLAVSLVGNVWLASRYQEHEQRLVGISGPPSAASPEAVPPARYQDLEARLQQEQLERSKVEARVKALEEDVRRSRASVSTFALAAGLLRAGGSLPRVSVPAGTLVVRLRLELPGDEYPFYRAALLDAEGGEIWAASKLKAEGVAGQTAVVLVLPSGLLPRGDYQVKLVGVSAGGEAEVLASYAFRVSVP